MRVTNNLNWDPDIVAVLETVSTHGPVQDRVWMSHLAMPPRIRQLLIRHWDDEDFTIDAAHLYRRFLGVAIHSAIEDRSPSDDSKAEEKLVVPMHGIKLVGRADKWRDGVIKDWKTTGAFGMVSHPDGRPEYWEAMNGYTVGFRHSGYPVHNLAMTFLILGWDRHRAKREKDYPQTEVIGPIIIPAMDEEQSRGRVSFLVANHLSVAEMPDDRLPGCTTIERWQDPDTWAVYKWQKTDWGKRASKVEPSEDAAQDWIDWKNDGLKKPHKFEIRFRPSEPTRCQALWCDAFQVCPLGQGLRAKFERSVEVGQAEPV